MFEIKYRFFGRIYLCDTCTLLAYYYFSLLEYYYFHVRIVFGVPNATRIAFGAPEILHSVLIIIFIQHQIHSFRLTVLLIL